MIRQRSMALISTPGAVSFPERMSFNCRRALPVVATARIEGLPGTIVDAVAVGLFPEDAGGARSLPIAAAQISASRGEVGIVAGDVVVASAPLVASADAQTFTLRVSPEGTVSLNGARYSVPYVHVGRRIVVGAWRAYGGGPRRSRRNDRNSRSR